MLRKTLLLTAALLSTTACLPAWGRSLVEIDVIDRDTGQWLPETRARGRTWVAGAPGHRYSVRLTNTTGERVLVVLSVDGVNAVSGETANAAQTGYVLAPGQSTEINGWRKSLEDVAQFVFTDLPDSYAARTGRPDNVGVIGIAVFREARPVAWEPPAILREEARAQANERHAAKAAAPGADAADAYSGVAPQQRLGTGHGAREWSPVGHTDFVRATRKPAQLTELRYDDMDTLVAMGVMPRRFHPQPDWQPAPRAFPEGFVADPPR